jgi:hypothetical protein
MESEMHPARAQRRPHRHFASPGIGTDDEQVDDIRRGNE